MRHFPRRLVVALLALGLFSGPLYADVIPTQYSSKSDAQVKVEARLTELGFTAEDARVRAARLGDEQASYFAARPERVQLVGQEIWGGQSDNLWWEWVLGAVALAGGLFLIHVFAVQND